MIASLISFQIIYTQLIIFTLNHPFCRHTASFKIKDVTIPTYNKVDAYPNPPLAKDLIC